MIPLMEVMSHEHDYWPYYRNSHILAQFRDCGYLSLSGGFFQGNILCSPDASAGTLLASIGVYILGVQGGLIAALLVFIGNRLCADNGYAGVVGSLTMTVIVFAFSFIGITPEMFICGMIIAIFTIQGIYHPASTKLLGRIAKAFGRYTDYE